MTGREKIEAAFSGEGTPEIPAVIPYGGIFIRDHWDSLTDYPWWYAEETDVGRQMEWRREVVRKVGQDWLELPGFPSRGARRSVSVEMESGEVYRVDRRSGTKRRLERHPVGGMETDGGVLSVHPPRLPETWEEIERLVPPPPEFVPEDFVGAGCGDLAAALLHEFGGDLYPIGAVGAPLWHCYGLWGFEGLMMMTVERPELVSHACERFLAQAERAVRTAAALGSAGIWIEDCMTDMISPAAFASLNLPFLRRLVDIIRDQGLHSIYYLCGNPAGKWDSILGMGADAVSLEEGKKGFRIEIEEVAERAGGRCTVLGNLDAIGLLPCGSESDLRREIGRQIRAGKRNRSRFIMSLGSPVTPRTTVERVRRYTDLVHELGNG